MQVVMRRAGLFVVAALVALSVGVVVPAGSAQALVSVPPPVQATGSQWSTAFTAQDPKVINQVIGKTGGGYVSPAQVGSAARKVGTFASEGSAGAVLAAAWVGVETGGLIAKGLGLSPDGNTGCELGAVLTGNGFASCGPKASTYMADSDVATFQNGWLGGAATTGVRDLTLPGLGAVTGHVTDTATERTVGGGWTGECPAVGNDASPASFTLNVRFYVYVLFSGSYQSRGSSLQGGGTCNVKTGSITGTPNPYNFGVSTVAGMSQPFIVSTFDAAGTTYPSWAALNAAIKSASTGSFVGSDGQTYQNQVTYYSLANPLRPPDVGSSPVRHWRTDWTCGPGSTGSAMSSAFNESTASWPAFPTATCEAGALDSVKVWQMTAGLDDSLVYEWSLPTEYTSNNPAPDECSTATPCDLLLERQQTPGSTKYSSCFSNPAACVDWWTETAHGTQAVEASEYRCTYGGVSLVLKECAVYAHLFDKGVYANPKTGETTSTTTTPDPSGPEQDANCPPPFSWSSLVNPWWYYKGVVCALSEAFVPNSATVTAQVTATVSTVQARPPFSLFGTLQPVFTGLTSGWSAGCTSRIADFDPDRQGRLAIPCTPPQSAPLTALYGVAVMALVVSTAFAVWHMLVAAIGGRQADGD